MKNLNPLEQVLALFLPINTFFFLFLLLLWSWNFRVTKFLDGEKEEEEGRERERERKKGIRSTQLVPVQRDFFSPRVSSCGERTVMKRRIIQAWYYLSKLFLQAVCRRTAGIPPWNWKEDYAYRRRSGREKKEEEEKKVEKVARKKSMETSYLSIYLKLTCRITRNYRPSLFFFLFFFFSRFTNTDYFYSSGLLQLLFFIPANKFRSQLYNNRTRSK